MDKKNIVYPSIIVAMWHFKRWMEEHRKEDLAKVSVLEDDMFKLLEDNTVNFNDIPEKVFHKAQKLWGLDHQAGRIVLDMLLLTFSLVGIGLACILAKKLTTGHAFFFFNRAHDRAMEKPISEYFCTPAT